ncbi:MAG: hypothetical protein K2H64_07395 [Desulfovibrio sp.]|nr:hypothetical protein [Desulfovibrio sp.]
MKVFIWGSCVSRDVFNYPCSADIECVGYFARCSAASAFAPPSSLLAVPLKNIKGVFRKSAVIRDFKKRLLPALEKTDFDILLIDFIDERLGVVRYPDGRTVTYSAELIESGFKAGDKLVKWGTEEAFQLWLESWKKFIKFCAQRDILRKLVINAPYWATKTSDGSSMGNYTPKILARNNEYLAKIYREAARDIPPDRFIVYPDSALISDAAHKWGSAPFHYTPDFYEYAARELLQYDLLIPPVPEITGRNVAKLFHYDLGETPGRVKIITNGLATRVPGEGIKIGFSRPAKYYYAKIMLPNRSAADGATIRFRLIGWGTGARWFAGWMESNAQYKVWNRNWKDGQWTVASIGRNDIIFRLDNPGARAGRKTVINDIRLLVFGGLKEGASLEISEISVWREKDSAVASDMMMNKAPLSASSGILLEELREYFKLGCPAWLENWEQYAREGIMPAAGLASVPAGGKDFGGVPVQTTLASARICGLAGYLNNNPAALRAARSFISGWLDKYFLGEWVPGDWREDTVGERLLTLIFLFLIGAERDFDARFIGRIRLAIVDHARLLSSDAFRGRQNHPRRPPRFSAADMAVRAASQCLPEHPEAPAWSRVFLERVQSVRADNGQKADKDETFLDFINLLPGS